MYAVSSRPPASPVPRDATASSPTVVSPRLSRGQGELQVDVAVLSGLCAVLAVCGSLVSLVVDLGAEGVGELLGGAAALLAQVVAFSEVLTQVLVIAVRGIQTHVSSVCVKHKWKHFFFFF